VVDVATESLSRARRDVRGACAAGDAQGVKRSLLNWGRLVFAESAPLSLGELSERIDGPLSTEVRRLDRALYGRDATAWDREALLRAFEDSDIRPTNRGLRPQKTRPLPDLYRLSG
jgi:hypothetical protein